jgi:hypothetical protein
MLLEILKIVIPVVISYIALLRTRTELDILYAKHREQTGEGGMRKRWYHSLKKTRDKNKAPSQD